MKFSNITYDRLKWFALGFIPAVEVLILTLGKIWDRFTDLKKQYDNRVFTLKQTLNQ